MTGQEQAAAEAHVKLAESAEYLEQRAQVQTDSADRRTELAALAGIWLP